MDSRTKRLTRQATVCAGTTLLEVLIVVAILGILAQLLMPAVQSAREAGRRTQCLNQLRQIGLATASHESATGRFPTGGWGYRWIGDPDRGNDRKQPGGWIFNLLPYLGEEQLHQRAKGLNDPRPVRAELQATVLPYFICPTRRQPGPFRNAKRLPLLNSDQAEMHARTDYAINGGDFPWNASVDIEAYREFDSGGGSFNYPHGSARHLSGICFRGSEIRAKDVTDGLSKCYLIGEKSMPLLDYESGMHWGDDQSMYVGAMAQELRIPAGAA